MSDEQVIAAWQRLTPEAMSAQLARNYSMISSPGPAAGSLAKVLLQDPLHLHELLQERLREQIPPGLAGGGEATFSPSGRDLLIQIEGQRPLSDLAFAQALTDAITRLANRENTNHLELKISGAYAIAAHSSSKIRADAINSTASSVIPLIILFAVLYRRPLRMFMLSFAPVAIGVVWGFGVYALIHPTITPLAAVVGGTLAGIGLDYSIHFVTHYYEMRAKGPVTPWAAMKDVHRPLLAAWLTSLIAFAAIGWSSVRVLRDFAIIGSLGLLGVYLATVFVLPSLVLLWQSYSRGRSATDYRLPIGVWLLRWLYPRSRSILIASVVVLIGGAVYLAIAGIPWEQETDLHNLHPRPNPPLDAQVEISRRMGTSADLMLIELRAPDETTLLQRAHDVQTRLKSPKLREVGVTGTLSLASLLPDPRVAAVRIDNVDAQRVEQVVSDFRAAVAASDFEPAKYEKYADFLRTLLAPESAPAVADLQRYPELARTLLASPAAGDHEALVYLFFDKPFDDTRAIDRAVTAIRESVQDLPGVTVTGMSVLTHDTAGTIHRDLPWMIAIAGLCVYGYLYLHFRSLRLALFAVLPTLLSFGGVLVVMRITGMRLNLVNLVMVPLLLGINIDYGIFAVDGLRRPEGRPQRDHFLGVVLAMLTCVGTTFLGFGSLVTVSVPAVRSLGWLMNVGLATSVLTTLLVLWPIVFLYSRRRGTE
jgi:predicted RND superfamily exporter protein